MKRLHVIYTIIGLLLFAWLILSVTYDAKNLPTQSCEDEVGSLCTESSICPEGFVMSGDHACNIPSMNCCLEK